MTLEEHQLMVGLYTLNLKMFRVLIEILKSRSIMDDSDLKAFYATLPALSGVTSDDLISLAAKAYRDIATPLGISLPKIV